MAWDEPSRAAVLAERGLRPYFVPDRRCAVCGGWFEVEEGWWCLRCADRRWLENGYCDECADVHAEECEAEVA